MHGNMYSVQAMVRSPGAWQRDLYFLHAEAVHEALSKYFRYFIPAHRTSANARTKTHTHTGRAPTNIGFGWDGSGSALAQL